MVTAFATLLVVHGLIHLLGAAKAFELAELPQLRQPISAPLGVLWLLAPPLFVGAAASLFVWPRWWWIVAAAACVISIAVIIPSWNDAKFGAIPNAIVAAGVVFGFLSEGPFSLRQAYERDAEEGLTVARSVTLVTDADLAHLPVPVQQYLRASRVVGQPRVHNFRAIMHGRIRNGPNSRWMPFSAEQYNFVKPPARLFYLTGSMFTIPVQGYHRYKGSSATMLVKAAALVPVVNASGAEMTKAETVTMLNDMCLLAPATLIDPAIQWETVDDLTAMSTFTNAGHTVRAQLSFNEAGDLTNFVSNDRYQTSADGKTRIPMTWSTPISAYRSFRTVRLPSAGEGRWHDQSGEYAYIQLSIDDVEYNVPAVPDRNQRSEREVSDAGR